MGFKLVLVREYIYWWGVVCALIKQLHTKMMVNQIGQVLQLDFDEKGLSEIVGEQKRWDGG